MSRRNVMQDSLEQIQHWLNQHAAQLAEYSLQAAASEQQILSFEKILSKTLPTGFKTLYQWHNGLTDQSNSGNLFYAMDFFPIERVEELYLVKSDMVDQLIALKYADLEIDARNAFNPYWIKFADDGACTGLYLDLAPTDIGQYGQVIFIDDEFEAALKVADSLQALIEDFNLDLQQGRYQLDQDALEDGHEFLQCDAEIDLINWQQSQRWKSVF